MCNVDKPRSSSRRRRDHSIEKSLINTIAWAFIMAIYICLQPEECCRNVGFCIRGPTLPGVHVAESPPYWVFSPSIHQVLKNRKLDCAICSCVRLQAIVGRQSSRTTIIKPGWSLLSAIGRELLGVIWDGKNGVWCEWVLRKRWKDDACWPQTR